MIRDSDRAGRGWRLTGRMTALGTFLCLTPTAVLALDVSADVRVMGTATDNWRLESKASAESDVYFDVKPRVVVKQDGARFDASLVFSPSLIVSPFNTRDSQTQHSMTGTADLEAVPRTILLDADFSVMQNGLSPFGATPLEDGTRSNNYVETSTYGVGAAWIGEWGADVQHKLSYRLQHTSSDSPLGLDSDVAQLTGFLEKRAVNRFGWSLTLDRKDTDYVSRPDTYTEMAVMGLTYRIDKDLWASARVGVERNSFLVGDKSNATYGAGLQWTPTSRTDVSVNWDHRYFGEAYSIDMSHRMRHQRLRFVASRDASTFAERFLQAEFSGPIRDELVDSRLDVLYPDPAAREQVERNLNASGFLLEDFRLGAYTDRISRRESARLSYSITGRKNSVTASIYRRTVETIVEQFSPTIPANLALNDNNVQKGGSVVAETALTPRATLSVLLDRFKTDGTIPGIDGSSTENSLRVSVNQRVTAKTSLVAGVRYRNLDSNIVPSFTERAVFGGLTHSF